MRVAVIDQNGCLGGMARYLRALLIHIKNLRPTLEITLFVHVHDKAQNELIDDFSSHGIHVKKLNFGLLHRIRGVRGIQRRLENFLQHFPPFLSGASHKEIEAAVQNYDLAFFNLWYNMRCPNLKCPMLGIFHDFNFRYYFSGHPIFSPRDTQLLFEETPKWLERCVFPIVSTHFMMDELKKFYPAYASKARVIHIAPMNSLSCPTLDEAQTIVRQLGIPANYILYPTNYNPHKNLGSLLGAVARLKKQYRDISLVVTGVGTSFFNGRLCETGIEIQEEPQDVFGLGYVSNQQMDALILCAKVVVSTSLYEAGNGPGLDAWAKGVPVAMSNIPAFQEHVDILGVRAEVFDPRSAEDIAGKIGKILASPEKARQDALHSQEMLQKLDWASVAKKYLEVFDAAVRN